ncbi:hypothetical protein [Dyella silvatica]|uniref:hypothetical protein n=1 Tax=Dyella silvatica TaxID=2992128 RepID=UPI00225AE7BE|nr:hypothetical protein [Dyella silvatica]
MNTYQKTATFIFRLVGGCWVAFFALMWSLYAIEAAMGLSVQHYPLHIILGNLGYIALGVFAVLAARPLGRLIGSGLDT